jgi:ATP-dependent RNA helicase DeaD
MRLPSHADITDRRIARFKRTLTETLAAQDLATFERVVEGYRDEHGVEMKQIAAALTFLAQRARPFTFVPASEPEPAAMPADAAAKRRTRRYRIEVGRDHDATTKQIVGALASEARLDRRAIGPIVIHAAYSTVELPELGADVLRHLQRVRVRNRWLRIAPVQR